jgi:mono/diheme cytochrome c family protein
MRMTEIVALSLLAACGAEQAPVIASEGTELIPATREETRGKHLFFKFCYQCHPGGSQGLGPALDDKSIAESAIRTQIRVGVGSMPAFGKDWLSDDQVAEIAQYVTTLHKDSIARTAYR